MAQLEEHTGQLHIFLGAAPGVGKTWAMVDAAQQKRVEGSDVVIGHVRTHERPEFGALLAGLEVIPLQEIEYQGVHLQELDLETILRRHPHIVLIDDLAHSNVPGTRHAKRYQDIIDLLQSGISVYTTLSVQHVSSVADVVARLTGVQVYDQVPDFVLEMASSIRLIDLAPEELLNRLLKRLHQGQDAQPELQNLFEPKNLVTLRELALRVAASRVDSDAQTMNGAQQVLEPWSSSSKIVVGVSASPSNERLLHATERLVREMRTTWLAVHVETPADSRLDDDARQRVQYHLGLAKKLGAETLTVAGQGVPQKLVEVAEQYDATRIVVGRSKKRGPFGRVRSLAEEIIELSETMDVIILSG
jgi:two-component system sensor histidine kinase KdpD